MGDLILVLMRRDGLTRQEAVALVEECRQMVRDGESPEEVLLNELGLEPDYFLELM